MSKKILLVDDDRILLKFASDLLEKEGHEVEVIDAIAEAMDVNDVVEQTMRIKPGLVGLSAMTDRIHDAAIVAEEIKRIDGGIITVAGGSHSSALPLETIEEFPSLDFSVFGEGEETLLEISRKVSGGFKEKIDGAVLKGPDGNLIRGAPRALVEDLDEPHAALDESPGE